MAFRNRVLILFLAALFPVNPASAGEIVINAVGDIMLAGSGRPSVQRFGCDHPFAATAGELQRGDIAVGNLEAPLARGGSEFPFKRFRFRADPRCAASLKRAGFSVLTLANNHIMDYGAEALEETLLGLDSQGILAAGAGPTLEAARRAATIQVKGSKVAFLAYSLTLPVEFFAAQDRPGTAPGYPAYIRSDIARARKSADYVIVAFHWGQEGETVPRPNQIAAAHAAIDAGADVVLGHHPHVLEGIERYRRGVIFYSLGNFAFGSASHAADRSVIARITLADGVREVELVPINVLNSEVRYQPKLLAGKQAEAVIAHLNRISREMGTNIVSLGGRYFVNSAADGQVAGGRRDNTYAQVVHGH
jgi:poly-gamma-glutamate capsule biosynthesis protein CapA/YwtB (metallophosphatase superfamily)